MVDLMSTSCTLLDMIAKSKRDRSRTDLFMLGRQISSVLLAILDLGIHTLSSSHVSCSDILPGCYVGCCELLRCAWEAKHRFMLMSDISQSDQLHMAALDRDYMSHCPSRLLFSSCSFDCPSFLLVAPNRSRPACFNPATEMDEPDHPGNPRTYGLPNHVDQYSDPQSYSFPTNDPLRRKEPMISQIVPSSSWKSFLAVLCSASSWRNMGLAEVKQRKDFQQQVKQPEEPVWVDEWFSTASGDGPRY
nr:hypothetical protein CFP56_22148 [Quercus suber]